MTKEELNQAWNLLCDLRDELPEEKDGCVKDEFNDDYWLLTDAMNYIEQKEKESKQPYQGGESLTTSNLPKNSTKRRNRK